MRILLTVLLSFSLLAGIAEADGPATSASRQVTVGVVMDGYREDNDDMMAFVKSEISELMRDEFDVGLPESKTIVADWTVAGIQSAVDRLLADEEVDLVLGLGTISSDYLCSFDSLPKPVVAAFVVNAGLQGIPFDGLSSGVENLSYIVIPHDICSSVGTFRDVVDFKNITFLIPEVVIDAIPELIRNLTQCPSCRDLDLRIVSVGSSAEQALPGIREDAEAVFVGVMLQMTGAEFTVLVDGLNSRKLPTFAFIGETDVAKGLLAGYGEGLAFPRIARRIALNIQRILLGEDAGSIPVAISRRDKLIFNMETARRIGISPSWKILTEAVVINEVRSEAGRIVDLSGAVTGALNANLDLAAKERYVAARSQAVGMARSALLPNVELSALGTLIDKDRAEASFGAQAERTITGIASLSQILFSEPAWANLSIQKDLYAARDLELEQFRLDIILDAATTYLNLLSAKTSESIQKDNLNLTRTNLEIAQTRRQLGVSGPGEVYRWEAELASNRKSVVDAQARRNAAEIALNRLLHRPAEEPFLTAEADIDSYLDLVDQELFDAYVGDKAAFRTFREFVVEEGLETSPELKQLDKALAAQNRLHTSSKRSFWIPTLSLHSEVSDVLYENGAGTVGGLGQLLPQQSGMTLPESDDTDWSVSLRLSHPIFSGGSRFSALAEAREDLSNLRLQRDAAAERVELQIRTALHFAGASYASISFTRSASDAAQKNLELVTDAYSRGAVPIVDLLDAQNAALVADLVAANAIFEFLIDLMKVQRAAGKFYSLAPEDERTALIERLRKYFEEQVPTN